MNEAIDYNSNSPTAETTAVQSLSDRDLRVPCYCEENAWRVAYLHLCGPDSMRNNTEWDDYHVVFVSNEGRCCPFYRQRALPNNPREYVCWDYHVFVIRSRVDEQKKKTIKRNRNGKKNSIRRNSIIGKSLQVEF